MQISFNFARLTSRLDYLLRQAEENRDESVATEQHWRFIEVSSPFSCFVFKDQSLFFIFSKTFLTELSGKSTVNDTVVKIEEIDFLDVYSTFQLNEEASRQVI